MKRKLTLLLWFAIPLFCMAQNTLVREYDYDAAGNRVYHKVIEMHSPPFLAPPAPQEDSQQWTSEQMEEQRSEQVDGWTSERVPEELYFVEKVAQVEIKIYPNPTTEKVTLEISGWQDLQVGEFKLFSPTGQLLQEHPVDSSATEVSLAGLPKGAYILKVQINNRTENWKIIKH